MDIFYPYKHAPNIHNGVQLVYSLRSVERYLIGFDSLYIVGDIHPNINANYIPFVDDLRSGFKDANIWGKCRLALNIVANGKGLMMNDDHYILQPFDCLYYPYFFREGDMLAIYFLLLSNIMPILCNAMGQRVLRVLHIVC